MNNLLANYLYVFVCGIALLLSSCGDSDNSSSEQKKLRIVFVPKGSTHVFWRSMKTGAEQAAKESGVDIVWKSPEKEDDIQTQINVIESFENDTIDGFIISPLDTRLLVEPLTALAARDIPIIVVDSELESSIPKTFIATDNYLSGKKCAEHLADLVNKKGKILLLRYMKGSGSTSRREEGFIDAMREYAPNVQIVGSHEFSGAIVEDAFLKAQELLSSHHDIVGVFCANEPTSQGMLRALETIGKGGKVKFVGFDANETLIHALEKGNIDALAVQSPYEMGYKAVKTIVEIKNQKIPEKFIETDTKIITKNNLNDEAVQKYLRPADDL
jgi:ribose transport system substrate-binding protein